MVIMACLKFFENNKRKTSFKFKHIHAKNYWPYDFLKCWETVVEFQQLASVHPAL